MLTLQLTDGETGLLHEIIEAFLENLRVEIIHTEKLDYREILK
jgi:hypothetical protein